MEPSAVFILRVLILLLVCCFVVCDVHHRIVLKEPRSVRHSGEVKKRSKHSHRGHHHRHKRPKHSEEDNSFEESIHSVRTKYLEPCKSNFDDYEDQSLPSHYDWTSQEDKRKKRKYLPQITTSIPEFIPYNSFQNFAPFENVKSPSIPLQIYTNPPLPYSNPTQSFSSPSAILSPLQISPTQPKPFELPYYDKKIISTLPKNLPKKQSYEVHESILDASTALPNLGIIGGIPSNKIKIKKSTSAKPKRIKVAFGNKNTP